MQIGLITVDGSPIGVVSLTVGDPDTSTPEFSARGPLTLVHNRGPAGDDPGTHDSGAAAPPQQRQRHHGGSHREEAKPRRPDHRHGPGHYPRGEGREQEQAPKREQRRQRENPTGNIPYSSSGNPFDRARFARELQEKPWLKEKMAHISLGENQDPHANLAVLETMMNRAVVRGTSLEQQARRHRSSGKDESGYYAGWAPSFSDNKRAMFEHNLGEALGQSGKGQSNITNYATDNSSGALAAREKASGSFVHHGTMNGESFFSPGHAEPALRDKWQRLNKQATEFEKSKTAETAAAKPFDPETMAP